MRFLSISIILLILLSPVVDYSKTKILKPKSIILVDNSISIKLSSLNPHLLIDKINSLQSKLSNLGFEVETFCFDTELKSIDSLRLNGQKTNIINGLQSIFDINSQDNLKNIILLSDGNYNLGNNPLFVNNFNFIEIFPILIGDTTSITDIKIEDIDYNPIMLTDESNLVQVQISTIKSFGNNLKVKLCEIDLNTRLVSEIEIGANSKSSLNCQFKLSNLTKGQHHYRVIVDTINNEKNTRNNQFDFFIEVVDGVKKIEILANAPHPDISAIKQILYSNRSFQLKTTISNTNLNFSSESDLLILYQLPSINSNIEGLIKNAIVQNKSILFVLGTQSNFEEFNRVQSSYSVSTFGNSSLDYIPVVNPQFNKFYLSDNAINFCNRFPPLSNKSIRIRNLTESSTLLNSKITNINEIFPLITVSNQGNHYLGLIAAENIWKWRLQNYNFNKSTTEVDDVFTKLINLLVIKKDKKQLVSNVSNNFLPESEQLIINANTYNELFQFEKVNDIKCLIKSSNGFNQSFCMNLQDGFYTLKPTLLNQGEYSYTIEANIKGKRHVAGGKFSIYKENIEDQLLPSNFEDMNSLAIKNDGKLYFWNNYLDLFSNLSKKEQKEKIAIETNKLKPNDILGLLLCLLFIISIEWVCRKYLRLH